MNTATPRTPIGSRARPWIGAAMLLPAVGVVCAARGIAALVPLLAIVFAAVLGRLLAATLRRSALREALADGSAPLAGLVLGLCLPAALPTAPAAFVLAMAVLAVHTPSAEGQPRFPSAMLALAALMLWFPAGARAPLLPDAWRWAPFAPAGALALAYAAGGLALIGLRLVRASQPLAVLAGAALALLCAHAIGQPITTSRATLMLLAFFIASDPALAVAGARARLLAGLGLGALCLCLPVATGELGAMPFAALLVAALAPWLDGLFAPRRPAPEPTDA